MQRTKIEKRLLRVPEACETLGVSRTKLNELMNAGLIKRVKVDRGVRITLSSIDQYIERLEQESDGGR